MKKILMGLMAVSAISFAAAPTLTDEPQEGKNVFSNTKDGAIKVVGKFTSTVPVVKYVVFASTGDGSSLDPTADSTLTLSDFTIEKDYAGFAAVNPTVYVRKVEADNKTLSLPTGEFKYKVNFDPAWTGPASDASYNQYGTGTVIFTFGALMNRASLDSALAEVTEVKTSDWGAIVDQAAEKQYITKQINFVPNGSEYTLKVEVGSLDSGTALSSDIVSKVNQVFAGGLPTDPNLAIQVRVR